MNTHLSIETKRCGCSDCACQPCLCVNAEQAMSATCTCGDDCNCDGAEQGCLCN